MGYEELIIERRNAVLEVSRSGKTIGKLFVLGGCRDSPVHIILREARKYDTIINYVPKERLDQISETEKRQGVIAYAVAYEYAEVKDMLKTTEEKGKPPLLTLLDGIKDPHNLEVTIRTVNLAGTHGVIIPEHRAVGLTVIVAKTSTGALNYTPVAEVTNPTVTMRGLKKRGIQFVCADTDRELVYKMNLEGSVGLAIGNEGEGVGKLAREHCDMVASIPVEGGIDSLNALVTAGMLAYEIIG